MRRTAWVVDEIGDEVERMPRDVGQSELSKGVVVNRSSLTPSREAKQEPREADGSPELSR